jgi:hypothetical protein
MASETRLKRWNTLHLDTSEEFIRFFIEQVDNPDGYYTRKFETHAFEVFDQCDYDSNGMLTGQELEHAVFELIPEVKEERKVAEPAFEGADFTEEDRWMLEMEKAFVAMLHIPLQGYFEGIPRRFMPAFARFCWSFRIFDYFNTPKINVAKDENQQAKLDLVFIGGAFVHRREAILAKLYVHYHKLFDFPVPCTDRPPSSHETNGLHCWFLSAEEFDEILRLSDSDKQRQGFVFTYDHEGFRYGYKYMDFIEPNRQRGKVALLSAFRTSHNRAPLEERENRHALQDGFKDFNILTICFAAPLEHYNSPPQWVGGSCDEFFSGESRRVDDGIWP